MTTFVRTFAAAIVAGGILATAAVRPASAQPAVSAFLPVADEPAPRLIVEPPIPHRLAAGAVLIPYRTDNFRILPIFGPNAVDVSPRAGHLHVTVDDLPWHWADASDDQTVVVVGLPPGPHKILLELALPDHRVLSGHTVTFVVPETKHNHR